MELVRKENGIFVFQEKSYSRLKEFTVRDMKLPFMGEENNWRLVRLEDKSLGDDNTHYVMTATFDYYGNYAELNMRVGPISRKIAFNMDGMLLRDYIVDSFLRHMDSDIYVAFGDVHDYSGENVGPHLTEYLQGKQVFRNSKDETDVLDNRWLLNDFFLEFFAYNRVLSDKARRCEDGNYPQQLKLEV